MRLCAFCREPFPVSVRARGRTRVYCSSRCRTAAYRLRVLVAVPRQETDEAAPLRSFSEAEALLDADLQLLEHGAEIFRQIDELDRIEEKQMAEAESSGRAVWRYQSDDEEGLREAGQAFRKFSDDVWVDWS